MHRINIVEPDGTPRLIISDKAEFPGSPFKGKVMARPDRSDSAGMLFVNNEGTENGGLIFSGYQSGDGKFHSDGHLSFDEYEQDQTLAMDTDQDGDDRFTRYQINDNAATTLFTPNLCSRKQNPRHAQRPGEGESPHRIRCRSILFASASAPPSSERYPTNPPNSA